MYSKTSQRSKEFASSLCVRNGGAGATRDAGTQGETLFGMTGNEMKELRDIDPSAYRKKLDDALFQPFQFRVKMAEETYNDEVPTRCHPSRAHACAALWALVWIQ